jgi:hypothetical protein
MIKSYKNFLNEINSYKEYQNKLNKDDKKYNTTTYSKIELKLIELIKNIIEDELIKKEDIWAGDNWYAKQSNKLLIKNELKNIKIELSKNSVWAIEIRIDKLGNHIDDVMNRNMIIDHILEKIEILEERICKYFDITFGVKYKDFHMFDYNAENVIPITNDKLKELVLRLKDTENLKDATDEEILEYLNK